MQLSAHSPLDLIRGRLAVAIFEDIVDETLPRLFMSAKSSQEKMSRTQQLQTLASLKP